MHLYMRESRFDTLFQKFNDILNGEKITQHTSDNSFYIPQIPVYAHAILNKYTQMCPQYKTHICNNSSPLQTHNYAHIQHTHKHMYTHHTYIRTHIHTHIHTHTHTCLTHSDMYTHTHAHTHTHTHTHTRARARAHTHYTTTCTHTLSHTY